MSDAAALEPPCPVKKSSAFPSADSHAGERFPSENGRRFRKLKARELRQLSYTGTRKAREGFAQRQRQAGPERHTSQTARYQLTKKLEEEARQQRAMAHDEIAGEENHRASPKLAF